jgi:hypothetical protein
MKTKKITLIAALCIAKLGICQIYTPSGVVNGPSGSTTNVGIGTGSGVMPNAKLEILGTANQFRLSNTSTIFNDINTNASGYLTVMPSNTTSSRIGFNTTAPVVGLHVNMGTFRLTDPTLPLSTRAFQVSASYPGNGDIPAGTLVSSMSSATTPDGLSFIPSAQGVFGSKLGAYAYSPSGWKSVWETANVNSASPNLLLVSNGGNVGIGTGAAAPTSHLQMVNSALGSTAGNKVQWVNFSGNAGTGNNDQLKIFHNRYVAGSNWFSSEIKIQRTVDASDMNYISFRVNPTGGESINFGSGNTDFMSISNVGQVAIGALKLINPASHPNAKLTVGGEIDCMSLYVLKPTSWQDRVFENEYKLEKLNSIEKYILEFKHLPGIKSEKEILEKGYDVNEIDAVLLEKIENLYLYIIQQQKEIDELKNKMNK